MRFTERENRMCPTDHLRKLGNFIQGSIAIIFFSPSLQGGLQCKPVNRFWSFAVGVRNPLWHTDSNKHCRAIPDPRQEQPNIAPRHVQTIVSRGIAEFECQLAAFNRCAAKTVSSAALLESRRNQGHLTHQSWMKTRPGTPCAPTTSMLNRLRSCLLVAVTQNSTTTVRHFGLFR